MHEKFYQYEGCAEEGRTRVERVGNDAVNSAQLRLGPKLNALVPV